MEIGRLKEVGIELRYEKEYQRLSSEPGLGGGAGAASKHGERKPSGNGAVSPDRGGRMKTPIVVWNLIGRLCDYFEMSTGMQPNTAYWNAIADTYQRETRISCDDFHYGPLLPGDAELKLLPETLDGLRCLEIGSGAGQNSIVLARRGAEGTALDISRQQIEHGRALAEERGVNVRFIVADMDDPMPGLESPFDLVHSTYALPFSRNAEELIHTCGSLLRDNGMFLLTTGHPLYAGDWIEFEPGEEGLFLHNYHRPAPDVRDPGKSHHGSTANYYPISTVMGWLRDAGFVVDRFLEPEPLPIPLLEDDEIQRLVPYESDEWRALYPTLSMVPVVMIFKCWKRQGGLDGGRSG